MGHLPAEILGLLFSLIATLEGVLEMMQKSKTFLWDFVVRKKKCSLHPDYVLDYVERWVNLGSWNVTGRGSEIQ